MSFLLSQGLVDWPLLLTAFFGAYLCGSVPYGLLLGRLAGLGDIRKAGSGNIGATNVLRLGGKKLGAITLLLDMLKGFIPVLVAKAYHMDYAVVAALGAFVGHLFPLWLNFRGGKGVATAIGVLTALWWQVGVAIVCIWILTAMISRYSSLSALTAFGVAPVLALVLTGDYQVSLVTLLITVVIWIRHHANIRRLVKGEESRMNLGSSK